MENRLSRQEFFRLVFFNVIICFILIVIAFYSTLKWFTLILPILFFILISFQKPRYSVQHALFIAILMLFVPILSAMSTLQVTMVYCSYYFLTALSFDIARRLGRPLPLPDYFVPLFILLAILLSAPTNVQFGICMSYYIARGLALVILNHHNFNK